MQCLYARLAHVVQEYHRSHPRQYQTRQAAAFFMHYPQAAMCDRALFEPHSDCDRDAACGGAKLGPTTTALRRHQVARNGQYECQTLFTGVDVLNAVSLSFETRPIRALESRPAAIHALILVRGYIRGYDVISRTDLETCLNPARPAEMDYGCAG